MTIDGNKLKEWGFKPGKWFSWAISLANELQFEGKTDQEIIVILKAKNPESKQLKFRSEGILYFENCIPEGDVEKNNIASVKRHMNELVKVPTIESAAYMPDACPAGSATGTIPVGGVVATKNAIHPGFHSADICCSVAMTVFNEDLEVSQILDKAMEISHFGPIGREDNLEVPPSLIKKFKNNPYLHDLAGHAQSHFMTQGDGNHFFYVGRLKSDGKLAIVTHHGSRKPGAMLYKKGMKTAQKITRKLSPETPKHNAWIPFNEQEGQDYWEALQLIREWTKYNHYYIHDAMLKDLNLSIENRFWNEHNFVFERNGLFYHGKGATPAWDNFSDDTEGLTLIPLNMAEPILITRGKDADHALGFSPHGAGRNISRTQFMKQNVGKTPEQIIHEQAKDIDVRFYTGNPDLSELPGAYKNAQSVKKQIEHFGLAEIVDEIQPLGSIMAGHSNIDWKNRKKKSKSNT